MKLGSPRWIDSCSGHPTPRLVVVGGMSCVLSGEGAAIGCAWLVVGALLRRGDLEERLAG